jgi:hypothetical protein
MDLVKTFVSGIVVIGLVTAVGLHAAGLAQVTTATANGAGGLLNTAEKG